MREECVLFVDIAPAVYLQNLRRERDLLTYSIQKDTISPMYAIFQTELFSKWLHGLKDTKGKIAIARRVARAQGGNLGDVESVGGSVCEMRVDIGPGYRVYYTIQDGNLIILLCGGDKSSQKRDITKAKEIAKEFLK